MVPVFVPSGVSNLWRVFLAAESESNSQIPQCRKSASVIFPITRNQILHEHVYGLAKWTTSRITNCMWTQHTWHTRTLRSRKLPQALSLRMLSHSCTAVLLNHWHDHWSTLIDLDRHFIGTHPVRWFRFRVFNIYLFYDMRNLLSVKCICSVRYWRVSQNWK